MAATSTQGSWAPRFAPLVELFDSMVVQGEERGAIAVLGREGPLVDIYGGAIHPGSQASWQPDTLACCFSVSKGVCAIAAQILVERGELDLDWKVTKLWPEFAAQGKDDITVLDVLAHRAGLPAVDGPARRGDLYDWERMTTLLAASAPVVPARSHPVYHNMTYGYLVGEILRRASGKPSLRAVIEDLLCHPLDADFRIGLDPGEEARCATIEQDDPQSLFDVLESAPDTLFGRSMAFFGESEDFNTSQWRKAEIGSGSGHATAKALAKIFGQLIFDDSMLSKRRQEAIRQEQAATDGLDPVMEIPIRFGEGIELSTPPTLDFGPNSNTPGHWGAGGATAFADPDAGIAFGYVTGRMASGLGSSERARSLVAALYECL